MNSRPREPQALTYPAGANPPMTTSRYTYSKLYQKHRYATDPVYKRSQMLKARLRYYKNSNKPIEYENTLRELQIHLHNATDV